MWLRANCNHYQVCTFFDIMWCRSRPWSWNSLACLLKTNFWGSFQAWDWRCYICVLELSSDIFELEVNMFIPFRTNLCFVVLIGKCQRISFWRHAIQLTCRLCTSNCFFDYYSYGMGVPSIWHHHSCGLHHGISDGSFLRIGDPSNELQLYLGGPIISMA